MRRGTHALRRVALALVALGSPGTAQIVDVELKPDCDALDTWRASVIERAGKRFLRGEPQDDSVSGRIGERVEWPSVRSFALFLLDPDEPADVPYRWKDDEQVPRSKARLAILAPWDIVEIRVVDDHTLDGLAEEYVVRRARIGEVERRRDRCDYHGAEWYHAHFLLLEAHLRLENWLERHHFDTAADNLDRAIQRLTKTAGDDPRVARRAAALASPAEEPVPPALEKALHDISGAEDRMAVHASRHLRIVHDSRIDERTALALLEFGEEVVDGFLREFGDPYECDDLVPDRVFSEFWFGPDADEKYRRYYEEYYGCSFGEDEELRKQRLDASGTYPVRSTAPEFITYWRRFERRDLFGLVAHRVGEQLAAIHFEARLRDGYNPGVEQDWLKEAFGIYVSLEHLGDTTASCTTTNLETRAGEAEVREQYMSESAEDYLQSLARDGKRPLEQLVLRQMPELGAIGRAQAWSFLRFLVRDDARGHAVLHDACRLSRDRAKFLATWRDELRADYGGKHADPLAALEQRWRASLPEEEE